MVENSVRVREFEDGCIVCPSTDNTFDLRTGVVRDWYPKNPVLRALTPILRSLLALSPEDVLPAVYLCTNKITPDHENVGYFCVVDECGWLLYES